MASFRHIVIGTGSMGAAACFHLASRGESVLGIDRFQPPHDLAAHGGQSRIIRKAYFEHPDYIPLLQKAYQNWEAIEKLSGQKIYHPTGLLYAGPKGHELIEKIKQSASLYNIPLHPFSPIKYPQFSFPNDHEILWEPDAGFLLPDVAIQTYLTEAKKAGAEIHHYEKFINWRTEGEEVVVTTDKGEYRADKIIFTAGPHTTKILPSSTQLLKITRQIMVWIEPRDSDAFSIDQFPCWLIAPPQQEGAYYGFPMMPSPISSGSRGIKIALHFPGEATDLDEVDRSISKKDTDHILDFIRQYIPSAMGEITHVQTCLYSMTPDEHFVIDRTPGFEIHACMAWGFSGHGFKFASAVGEVLADLSMYGKTDMPVGFLSADRFSAKRSLP